MAIRYFVYLQEIRPRQMLILQHKTTDTHWGIWKIEEDLPALLSLLDNTDDITTFQQTSQSETRIIERVATRVLLKQLLEDEVKISYYTNGKPYLVDSENHISISHTKGYVAVIISRSEVVGVDIEYISDRVKRIRSRFVSDIEYIDPSNEVLHLLLHWSAKESIYKALSREGVDFKNNLTINKFVPAEKGMFKGAENLTDHHYRFDIQYLIEKEYVLTFAYLSDKQLSIL